jgi:hypothetical protein
MAAAAAAAQETMWYPSKYKQQQNKEKSKIIGEHTNMHLGLPDGGGKNNNTCKPNVCTEVSL